jgi:hypothetical protein
VFFILGKQQDGMADIFRQTVVVSSNFALKIAKWMAILLYLQLFSSKM